MIEKLMDRGIINTLETNISRAIALIEELRDNKGLLEKENESLRRRITELQNQLAEQKKALSAREEVLRHSQQNSDFQEVKVRLEKLVGKLAALEDSWT